MREHYLNELDKAAKLAEQSKWRRLSHTPFRLIFSFFHRKMIYPLQQKGSFQKVKTFFGTSMTVNLPAGTDIYLLGIKTHNSEIRLARFLVYYLKSGMVFFDIGAHFGYFSLLAANLVGENGQVFSFEPSRSSLKLLKKNTISQNNIAVIPKAVGKEESRLILYEFPLLQSEYNTLEPTHYKDELWYKKQKGTQYEVDIVSIDGFCKTEKTIPNLIKIDVEGAEWAVVQGMLDLLIKCKTVVILEYVQSNKHFNNIFELMNQNNFTAHFILQNGSLQAIRDFKDLKEGVMDIESDNIVFVPNQVILSPQ